MNLITVYNDALEPIGTILLGKKTCYVTYNYSEPIKTGFARNEEKARNFIHYWYEKLNTKITRPERCERKRRFEKKRKALAHARRRTRQTGKLHKAYKCNNCKDFHLTTQIT